MQIMLDFVKYPLYIKGYQKRKKTMTLNEYVKENNCKVENFTPLFSVGSVLNTINGDMFPINVDASIDFDNPINIIEDEISEDFINALGWGEDVIFMNTLENLK